jgi:hypothetical protein
MKAFALVLLLLSLPTHAEVFKCSDPATKKTIYQKNPCAGAIVEKQIEVKHRSAKEEAAAAERLRNWKVRQGEEEALKIKIAREQWDTQLRAAEVDAARRSVIAQQEQARAQYKQAEEISKMPVPIIIPHR